MAPDDVAFDCAAKLLTQAHVIVAGLPMHKFTVLWIQQVTTFILKNMSEVYFVVTGMCYHMVMPVSVLCF